jgi:hypothetical protein
MNFYSGENFMNIKKTLITVGFSAALSAVPLIAQADLISQTAITAGVDVLAKDSSKLPNQKLVLTENTPGAVNDQFDDSTDDTHKKQIVLSLDNGAKFVKAKATWKTGTVNVPNSNVISDYIIADEDGNLVITGIFLNEGTQAAILTIREIFIDTSKTEVGKEIKISLNEDLTTATGAAFPALKIATVVDSDVEIKNASGTVPKIKPDNDGYIRDIIITENASGAIATERTPKTITVTLPTDWTFTGTYAANETTGKLTGHGTHTATPAQTDWTSSSATGNGPKKANIDGFFLNCKENTDDTQECSFTDFSDPSTDSKLYVDVDGGNENPGKITLGGGGQKPSPNTDANLGNIQVKAPKNASTGKYYATVTVELFNGNVKTEKVEIAEIVEPGITATVVDYKTDKFDTDPTADTTLPEYPKGFLDAILDAVMIVENYGDDLTTGDYLKLTLPTGVVFSSDWLAAAQQESDVAGGGTAAADIKNPIRYCAKEDYEDDENADKQFCSNLYISDPSNPKGFTTVTMTFNRDHPDSATTDDDQGGLLLGGDSSLLVNILDTAQLGDLVVELSGTVGGEAITPLNLTLAKIVEGGTKNETVLAEGEEVPTHGVGSSGRTIAKFTITELVNGTLKANNSTITLTLPEGVTWAKVPSIETTNLTVATDTTLTNNDRTVTLKVTTGSTASIGIITVLGDDQLINISADYTPGDINIEFGGTAGAAETKLLVAKAAKGTRLEVLEVTKLVAGKATQDIASIRVIENFAGALAPDGKFRLILPKGLSWAPAVPKVPTVLADGAKGTPLVDDVDEKYTYDSANDINEGAWDTVVIDDDGNNTYPNSNSWEFEISTTFNNKDTLVVQVPNTGSTGATVVPLDGLKVNVDASVADGTIKVTIDDGNTAGKDGAGVTEEDAVIGYIGELPEFKVEPLTVTVGVGDTVTVTATGGLGTANISTAPDAAIATATALNNVITIKGVAEGTTSVVISDGTTANQTKTVEITVTPAVALSVPATATVEVGKTTEVKITGGTADFTVTSSDDATATATLKDKTIIISGVAEGSATITVEDSADPKGTATVTVTVKKAGGTLPPAGTEDGKGSGVDKDGNPASSDAKYYGGVSDDSGATYAAKEIDEDKPITFKAKIEIGADHQGKAGKYYVVAGYQPADTQDFFWWFHKEDGSWVDWAPVTFEARNGNAYKETEALETIEITIVENFSLQGFKGNYFVFLSYETEDESIYYNLPAIEFTIK